MAKILVVEDNDMNLDMLTRRLKRAGFEIVTAGTGIEGIAAAQREKPDLILMDISLPELDGYAATGRLKADPATASIPVIALTAHAMSQDRALALQAGCDEYESKPVDFGRLLAKIGVVLGRSTNG